jgi:predicted nuclease of predicted toxin-antitoxin system
MPQRSCVIVTGLSPCRRDWDVDGHREEIVAWSLARRASVATLDADFHAILAVSRASALSVIRIRMQGLDGLAVVEVIQRVIADFGEALSFGSLVTVKTNKTTCQQTAHRRSRLRRYGVYGDQSELVSNWRLSITR